jgi:hypothetical protein
VAAFGLYPSAALVPAQRIAAATVLPLDVPRERAGVISFGRSLWLPLPAGLAAAASVRLVDSTLQVRFDARRFDVATGRRDWFPAVDRVDADTLRISFTWPAEVVRLAPSRFDRHSAVQLFRADGDTVADEPAATGITGRDLAEPWVGSPMVVRLGPQMSVLRVESEVLFAGAAEAPGVLASATAQAGRPARAVPVQRAAAASGPGLSGGTSLFDAAQAALVDAAQTLRAAQVPALTLSGRPTSPRLKLFAESAAGDNLLWLSMLPGEQASVNLPAQPAADEWAAALEQLRKLASDSIDPATGEADPATTPLRLRLDIESDAPCTATLPAPVLAVETETELLDAPRQLAFSGNSAERQPLPLTVPAGLAGGGGADGGGGGGGSGGGGGAGSSASSRVNLRLAGRIVANNDGAADAGAAPADGRTGALLDDGVIALQALDWSAPMSLAGVALHWQPLSDQITLRLRLLADDSGGPGARVLAQTDATIDTAQPGALALRWPALDLQAQRAWVEVAVSAGAGVWLFAGAGGPGWIETRSPAGARQPLPAPLTVAPIPAQLVEDTTRAIGVTIGPETLADSLPQGPFDITLAGALPAALASGSIVFTGAVRGKVSVESARWLRRDGG